MTNNFVFNASIKLKNLNKMNTVLHLMNNENIDNNSDYQCLLYFKNLLNSFDSNSKNIKMFDVIDKFCSFYENVLSVYCKDNLIMCDKIEEFEWEDVQYVMNKMIEIIDIVFMKYGTDFNNISVGE